MIQDDLDAKNGVAGMDIDEVMEEGEWKPTGQVLTGKGPQGEETLFMLQKQMHYLFVGLPPNSSKNKYSICF